jgi:hypothetical protein
VEDHTTGCRAVPGHRQLQGHMTCDVDTGWKDPNKQWLQMRYCITEGDIDMVIKDWEDEWKIPVLTQDLPERTTEEEAGQGETQPQEVPVPKKWRMGQTKTKQTNEGTMKMGTQKGKKDNTQSAKEQLK